MTPKDKKTLLIAGLIGAGALGVLVFFLMRKPAAPVIAAPAAAQAAPIKVGIEDQMIDMASRQLGVPREGLTVRGLSPTDLGLTSYNFPLVLGANTIVNHSIADSRFIAITGITYTGTVASSMTVQAGGSMIEAYPIRFISALQNQTWHDTSPTIIQQNWTVQIVVQATGAATELIALDGIVIEKRGMVLA